MKIRLLLVALCLLCAAAYAMLDEPETAYACADDMDSGGTAGDFVIISI